MSGATKEQRVHDGPHPHLGGCAGCRQERLCNFCGQRRDHAGAGGMCTNGRCADCHARHCMGWDPKVHGYGFDHLTERNRAIMGEGR
jgi:hypothetical protein